MQSSCIVMTDLAVLHDTLMQEISLELTVFRFCIAQATAVQGLCTVCISVYGERERELDVDFLLLHIFARVCTAGLNVAC